MSELAAGADPVSARALAPFLQELAAAENPQSTLRWFYTSGFNVARRLLAGEIEVSHRALDEAAVGAPQPVAFVRAKLVASGVLERRDERSGSFARWHEQQVLRIAAGPDRAHVRAFASWQVAHQLARSAQRRGGSSYASLKHARSLVSEAIKLVLWLHDQQLELADLRQDVLDQWVCAGASTRRRIRVFVAWLERGGVVGRLEVAWEDRPPERRALHQDERFAILRRLLHDREIDLRDRFAGGVLLLYGKPITKIVALTTSAISVNRTGSTALRLGRGEIPLPEPLDSIALVLRDQQLERAQGETWLLPGRHAETHLSAEVLRERLKRYGLRPSRAGRHAAVLALAARLPAPILAERIGIHQARAAQWVRLAGASYDQYVALRTGS